VTLCYECLAFVRGRSPVEEHHPLGRSNHPSTVSVPGNPHRALSNRMQDRGSDLLRGDPADPLLSIARLLQTIMDAAEWALDHLGDLIHVLLRLRQRLIKDYGSQWWEALGLGPLWRSK